VSSVPNRIHVSAAVDRQSLREVEIHRPRELERARHGTLAVTPPTRTLVDLGTVLEFGAIRRALAEADHLGLLDPDALEQRLERGRRGGGVLRAALRAHLPELARTRSVLEQRFLELCEAHGIVRPEVNVFVEGLMVDAHWRDARLVVELDGHLAHDRITAAERDRERDLILRRAGYRVHRYTWQQVTSAPSAVASDVLGALGSR
jgi:very-short-patch-repair endonuclease